MGGGDFIVGYFFGRRGFRRWTGRTRTRPKMASGPWRLAAALCTIGGMLVAWLLFRSSGALGWRLVGGAVLGFAVGMYVVESVWERRLHRRTADPTDDDPTDDDPTGPA